MDFKDDFGFENEKDEIEQNSGVNEYLIV